jgi:subtilisin family serine protease
MAAGNNAGATPLYPAAYASQYGLAVGAVTSTGAMASFSNKAGTNPLDYVVAPGVNIYSTLPGNKWGYKSGTSMASPIVAGVAALLFGANRALTPAAIENLLTSSAVPLGVKTASTTTTTTTTTTTLAKTLDLSAEPALQPVHLPVALSQPALIPLPSVGFGMFGSTGLNSGFFRPTAEQPERYQSTQSVLDDLDPLTRQPLERTRRQQRFA